MDAGKLLDGFFLRPTFQLDDFRKSFADFPAVRLDGFGRIAFQKLSKCRVGPCLRIDLTPLPVGDYGHCCGFLRRVRYNPRACGGTP
jgi:hypothetical protein